MGRWARWVGRGMGGPRELRQGTVGVYYGPTRFLKLYLINSLSSHFQQLTPLEHVVRLRDPLLSVLFSKVVSAGPASEEGGSPCLTTSFGKFPFPCSPHLRSLSSDSRHLPDPQQSQSLQITEPGQAGTKNATLAGGRRNKGLTT